MYDWPESVIPVLTVQCAFIRSGNGLPNAYIVYNMTFYLFGMLWFECLTLYSTISVAM